MSQFRHWAYPITYVHTVLVGVNILFRYDTTEQKTSSFFCPEFLKSGIRCPLSDPLPILHFLPSSPALRELVTKIPKLSVLVTNKPRQSGSLQEVKEKEIKGAARANLSVRSGKMTVLVALFRRRDT